MTCTNVFYFIKKFNNHVWPFTSISKTHYTKMKFSIKHFFSKCDQICSFLQTYSHLLKNFFTKNIIFSTVSNFSILHDGAKNVGIRLDELYALPHPSEVKNIYPWAFLFKFSAILFNLAQQFLRSPSNSRKNTPWA